MKRTCAENKVSEVEIELQKVLADSNERITSNDSLLDELNKRNMGYKRQLDEKCLEVENLKKLHEADLTKTSEKLQLATHEMEVLKTELEQCKLQYQTEKNIFDAENQKAVEETKALHEQIQQQELKLTSFERHNASEKLEDAIPEIGERHCELQSDNSVTVKDVGVKNSFAEDYDMDVDQNNLQHTEESVYEDKNVEPGTIVMDVEENLKNCDKMVKNSDDLKRVEDEMVQDNGNCDQESSGVENREPEFTDAESESESSCNDEGSDEDIFGLSNC